MLKSIVDRAECAIKLQAIFGLSWHDSLGSPIFRLSVQDRWDIVLGALVPMSSVACFCSLASLARLIEPSSPPGVQMLGHLLNLQRFFS